jgi:hypothetical protein
MWYFRDLNCGYQAIFSTEEKANNFIKAYGIKMFELNNQFPIIGEDYILDAYKVDPDFTEFSSLL